MTGGTWDTNANGGWGGYTGGDTRDRWTGDASRNRGAELNAQYTGLEAQWVQISPPGKQPVIYKNMATGQTYSAGGGGGMYSGGGGDGGGGGGFDFNSLFNGLQRDDVEGYELNPYEMTAYTGEGFSAPDPYSASTYDPASMVDVTDLIDAESRLSDTRRADAWADAAGRFGQSGMVASTPYMNQLADVAAEEEARKDQIFGQLRYQTGTDFANRSDQAGMFNANAQNQSAAMGYQGELAANQFNAEQALQQWMAENNIGMQNNQLQNTLGMQNYWNTQEFNQSQDDALMGQMMDIFGGMGYA